jgi:hypothetical protein
MKIDSNKVLVNATQQQVFDFLKDSNNVFHLMPHDKISDWQATTDQCSFKVQGGIMITLLQDGAEGNDKLYMKAGEKSPFPFRLTINIIPKSENQSEGFIQFDGEVNMFLKMMVEKPLTNLFNYMSDKLKEYFADRKEQTLGEA